MLPVCSLIHTTSSTTAIERLSALDIRIKILYNGLFNGPIA